MGKQNLKKMLAKVVKAYRLNVTEESSGEEINSFRVTRLSFAAIIVGSLVAILILLYAIIAFTPLRATIPGYPDAHFRKQAISNAIKIDSLESAITRWRLYSDNLARVVAGEETLELDSLLKVGTTKYINDKSEAELARRDSILRETVRQEEQFSIQGTAHSMPVEGIQFFPPVKGTVSQGFETASHPWIDITAPANSTVNAVLDGTVVFSGWDDFYGNTIIIQHHNNIISLYRNNSRLLKTTGDKITAGTPIAMVGSTGSLSSGEHLHFELWYKGEAVDPAKYISF